VYCCCRRESKDCEKHHPHKVTKAEHDLLKVDTVHLVSESNKDELQKRVRSVTHWFVVV
jgi:hypothetical protein